MLPFPHSYSGKSVVEFLENNLANLAVVMHININQTGNQGCSAHSLRDIEITLQKSDQKYIFDGLGKENV